MSVVSAEPKFEIGNLVYFRAAMHCSERRPERFCIQERIVQQCAGGIQILYVLDRMPGRHVAEVCLTAEEPPYRPRSDSEIAAHELEREHSLTYWSDRRKEREAAE